MNQKLQNILDIIQQSEKLDVEQKNNLTKAVKDADKELEITSFKLERTEKVKKTTAILLEETIKELEQKRKAVEAQNRELEIEASLERVRAIAMSMMKSEDLLSICEIFFKEFNKLGFNNLRNSLINIFNDEEESFVNYDYSDYMGGSISNVSYNSNPANDEFLIKIRKANDAFVETVIDRNKLDEWKEFRRSHGEKDDPRLDNVNALYYYNYSIGSGSIGISNFNPISEEQQLILKRFRNVFNLSYQRYADIAQAEAQAREAKIEAALEKVRAVAMSMQKAEGLLEVVEILHIELRTLGFTDIRNTIINIFNDTKENFINYDYSDYGVGGISEVDYNSHPANKKFVNKMREASTDFMITEFTGNELDEWKKWRSDQGQMPDSKLDHTESLYYYEYSIGVGSIGISTFSPISEDQLEVLKRFRNVFKLSYQRYVDITLAEAQAREAQIEGALERVRSKTMAMHNSNDVGDTVVTLFDEVLKLGIDKSIRCGIGILEGNEGMETWSATSHPNGKVDLKMGMLDMTIHPMLIGLKKAWESGETSYSYDYIGDDVFRYYEALNNEPEYPFQADLESLPENEYHRSFFYAEGILFSFAPNPISDEAAEILDRFARVFGQTYRRYLDLRRAEAQAREAQIEAALEKVRAVAMSMNKSEDLLSICEVSFKEFKKLGFDNIRNALIHIQYDEQKYFMDYDFSDLTGGAITKIEYGSHPVVEDYLKQINSAKDAFYQGVIKEDQLKEWKDFRKNSGQIDDPRLDKATALYYYFFSIGIGDIGISTLQPIDDSQIKILKRFRNVFDLAYRRYNDIAFAEAQARETQIQLALERVRARTMAMHKSNELADTAAHLFGQLKELGINPYRCNIGIVDAESDKCQLWSTTNKGDVIPLGTFIPLTETPSFINIYAAWKKKLPHSVMKLVGKDRLEMIKYFIQFMPYAEFKPEEMTLEKISQVTSIFNIFNFKQGFINIHTNTAVSEPDIKVIERFTKVFEQTYTRFLDLKKAEAQARDSQIEASLERVRSKAMSMHSPNNLSESVNVFFKELKTLGIIPIRCGVGHIDEATRTTSLTTTTSFQQGESFQVIGKIKQTGHPVLDGIFENWKLQKEYHPVLQGEDIKAYYDVMNPQIGYPDYPESVTQYGNMFYFKEGFIFAWTENKLSEEELQIFRRFTSVLSLTYRRYIDLKEAEARSVEAVRQASLDRVRAEIASMRTSEDLNHITPIIWRELKNLEVPFFRCGVFIVDEKNEKVQVYLTTPDGKSLGVLNLPFDCNELTSNTVDNWRKKAVYKEHWNKEEFISWTHSMMEIGQVQNEETYQGSANPPESLDLHFVPFAQGMLYVGNTAPLSKEKIASVKSLAEAFSIAYGRYEDFDRLEAAKKEVESAFGELDLLSKELKIKNEELETENQRKALELEEARQLQLSMLPKELPKLPNLDIAVYMKTATEVGGDYYDFKVDTSGTLTVAVGDATGHGMKAGTIVSMIKALFASGGSRMDMKSFFNQSSDALKKIELGRLMMAFIMLKIKSNKLEFANAGMPPLFIYRKHSGSVEEIMINGMPLGAIKDFPYKIREMEISSGDTILLLSDGLPELKNGKDEHYGYNRVKDEFKSAAEKSPDDIVSYLKNSATDWVNGVEPDDDVTFVIIKIR